MHQNLIAFAAHNARMPVHYHASYKLVISIKNTFTCSLDGETHLEMRGFGIQPNISHACDAPEASVFVLFVDTESALGKWVKTTMGDARIKRIESFFTEQQLFELQLPENLLIDKAAVYEKFEVLLKILATWTEDSKPPVVDERVQHMLDYMDANFNKILKLKTVAALVFLSPERARHLFVIHMGIPFRQYLLWQRIKSVIYEVLKKEKNIAEAAISAGFTDQAQFTTIFKRIFGTPVKIILKNSPSIQFLSPKI
jgi:AraC-like DNA-binding protein